jgi:Ca2+-binding RTX toxin-like protein
VGKELLFPSDEEFENELGVDVRKLEDGDSRSFKVEYDAMTMTYSFSQISGWVRLVVSSPEGRLIDITREGAVSMTIDSSKGITVIAAEFDSGTSKGILSTRVYPAISIIETNLLD